MRKLALLLTFLVASAAHAGENRHLGAIVVSGASLTNLTTAAPFAIPPGALITISCTASVQILVDNFVVSTGTTGTKGVPIPATTLFPTSVGKQNGTVSGVASAIIAIIGTATCDVWQRVGNE